MAENGDGSIVSAVPMTDRQKGEANANAFADMLQEQHNSPPPVDANVKGPLTRFFVRMAHRFSQPRAELVAMAAPPPPPRTEQQIQLDADILRHAENMDRIEARPDTGEMTPRAPGFDAKGKMAAPLGEMTSAFNADGTARTTARVPDAVRPFTEDTGVQTAPNTPPFTEKIGDTVPPFFDTKIVDGGGDGGGLNTGGVELPLDQIAALTGKRPDTSLPGGLNEQGLDLNALTSLVPKTQRPDIIPGVSRGNAQTLTSDIDIRGVGPSINPDLQRGSSAFSTTEAVIPVPETQETVGENPFAGSLEATKKAGELKAAAEQAKLAAEQSQANSQQQFDAMIKNIGKDPEATAKNLKKSGLSPEQQKQVADSIDEHMEDMPEAEANTEDNVEDITVAAERIINQSGLPEDKKQELKNKVLPERKKKLESYGKKLKGAMNLNNAYITFQIATMLMSIAAPQSVTGQ